MNNKASALDIGVITLFPEMFPGPLAHSLIGTALEQKIWTLQCINLREFGVGKHRNVDDTPYGGGAGMVLRADVVDAAITAARTALPDATLIYLTPRGKPFNQTLACELVGYTTEAQERDAALNPPHHTDQQPEARTQLIFLCGRFEAVDERVIQKHQPLEISLGDFVMTGGELAAMAIIDACVRLLPDVIGDAGSLSEESFGLSDDYSLLLEHPHYTRPPEWENMSVPDVLTCGDHAKIAAWRKAQAQAITQARRPDLWEKYQNMPHKRKI